MTGSGSPAGTDRPLVSAIVLTRGDRDAALVEAIESVSNQTYDSIELVVVDDSPEGVAEQIEAGRRGSVVSTQHVRAGGHGTVAAARNTGLRASSGEYLAFLDDDDRWRPTKTEKQLLAIRDDTDVGVVYTGQTYVEDGRIVNTVVPTARGDVLEGMLHGRRIGPTGTLMVESGLVARTGERFDGRLGMWEDRDWLLRLAGHCEFGVVEEALLERRVDSANRLSDEFENAREAHRILVAKHRGVAATHGRSAERQFLRRRTMKLVPKAIEQGELRLARRYALRSVRHDPTEPRPYLFFLLSVGGRPLYRSVRRLVSFVRQRVHSP
jgi:glycosyltransferase involved in cell wall biosynthesis